MPRLSNLAKLSTAALQAEIQRRQGLLPKLLKERDELNARIAELEGSAGEPAAAEPKAKKPGRKLGRKAKRVKNTLSLSESLASIFAGKEKLGVGEAAEAVLASGYKSNSKIFRTIVNQALLKNKRFKKVGRGEYTLKGGAKIGEKAAPAAKPAAKDKKPAKRGTFTETAEQMILGLLKAKPLTTADINTAWKQAGRGGTADVNLGKLVKGGHIKREKLPSGQRGSMYTRA